MLTDPQTSDFVSRQRPEAGRHDRRRLGTDGRMADITYKMTKLVGESSESLEAAVRTALGTSASKVHGQTWAHVTDIRVALGDGGALESWQVALEVAFKVDE